MQRNIESTTYSTTDSSTEVKKQKITDPHVHFFNLHLGHYEWLKAQNPPHWPDKSLICKDTDFSNLTLDNFELQGAVHIEAGFNNNEPAQELDWLNTLVSDKEQNKPSRPKLKTIAGLNLFQSHHVFASHLDACMTFDSFMGIRHIFDDITSVLGNHSRLLSNLHHLQQSGNSKRWIYELQMNFCEDTQKVKKVYEIFKNFDSIVIVINHCGFRPSREQSEYATWRQNLLLFASLPWVHIKCSGFEMINRQYTDTDMQNTLEDLLNIFDVQRVMFASNFPLVIFSQSYTSYWGKAAAVTRNLTGRFCDVLNSNANRVYQFDSPLSN